MSHRLRARICFAGLRRGERLDPPTYDWLSETFKVPVLDHWWQTETGWAIAANLHGLEPMPVKSGSSTMPVPGFNVEILDQQGKQLEPNTQGYIAIKLPLPPSCLTSIWGDSDRFRANYLETYPGYFTTGDGGYFDDDEANAVAFDAEGWFRTGDVCAIDETGHMMITDRTKDLIKSGGEWISSIDLEGTAMGHPDVAEAAAIAMPHPKWTERPMLVVVPRDGAQLTRDDVLAYLDGKIVKWWMPDDVVFTDELPHTATGKVSKVRLRERYADHVLPTINETQ